MAIQRTIEDAWLSSDPDVGSYRLLPFDVPAGIARIEVRYSVQPLERHGRPGLDIGLFDPSGTDFMQAHGFRGWSGAFRSELLVSAGEVTPGYLRGPVQAGTWHILTGADAAMVTRGGMKYRIEITLIEDEQMSARAYLPYVPGVAESGQRWYKGNLHSHTYYSDGHNSIQEVADEYVRRGLQFGALTEHNILNPDLAQGARPGFIWLPAEEVTTYRGHLNVWGLSRWLDFRCHDEDQMQAVIDAAHAQGAVTSINHPKDDGPPWNFDLYTADCIEVWQAPWFTSNYQSLALWERLLKQGRRIVAVGGSDLHRIGTPDNPYPYNIDNPTTWVRASELSVPAILEGLSRGRVFISRDAQGPQVQLTAEDASMDNPAIMGDVVMLSADQGLTVRAQALGGEGLVFRLVTQNGVVHASPILSSETRLEYLWEGAGSEAAQGAAYVRAEVIRDMGPDVDLVEEPSALWMEAMSNPIYVRPAPARPLQVAEKVSVAATAPIAHK